MKREKLAFLNLYKFIASLIIACLLHYKVLLLDAVGLQFEGDNYVLAFFMSNISNFIVELFFMISGLLFSYAYLEKIEKGKLFFNQFFAQRLRRLVPLTVITTIVMFIVQIICGKFTDIYFYPGSINLHALISSVILMGSTLLKWRTNAPVWYISKLLLCYCLAYVLTKHRKRLGYFAYYLPILVGVIIQNTEVNIPLLEFHASRAYVSFFVGIITGIFLTNKGDSKCGILMRGGGFIPIGLAILLREYVLEWTDWSLILSCMVFPEILIIGYHSRLLNIISDNKITEFLGRISFDIYLWNCPILVIALICYYDFNIKINNYLFLGILLFAHVIVGSISNLVMNKMYKSMGNVKEGIKMGGQSPNR